MIKGNIAPGYSRPQAVPRAWPAAKASASGTQKVRTGNTVRIRRQSGTAAGTLTVAFGGTGTPSTNTTAPADLWYVFDGTNWQTFTPVTS